MLPDCLGVPFGARLASFESSPATVFGVFGTGVSVIAAEAVVVVAGVEAIVVAIFSTIGVFGIGVDGKRGVNGETGTASIN